jgi:hypothetical protein
MRYTAITYIGKDPCFVARVGSDFFTFQWQNGIGVGKGRDEIPEKIAIRISNWRDIEGHRLFLLE